MINKLVAKIIHISLFLGIFSAFFLISTKKVTADTLSGSCQCGAGNGSCLLMPGQNKCNSGYHAVCVNDVKLCSGIGSCSCDKDGGPDTNPSCGARGQPCCIGNICDTSDLSCAALQGISLCYTNDDYKNLPGNGPDRQGPLGFTGCNANEFSTAIGCIPTSPKGDDAVSLFRFFLNLGLAIAGGVSFLFIIYSGFLIMTSKGDEYKLQAGKELLGSAIGGLVFLIFAVVILRLFGVDILGVIPG